MRPGFNILNQFVVVDFQDLSWKNLVPMCHQPLMIKQLFSDPAQVIGEPHPSKLGAVVDEVVGHRHVTRLTFQMQNFGIGKQQLNQTYMLEIMRKLIDNTLKLRRIRTQFRQHFIGETM